MIEAWSHRDYRGFTLMAPDERDAVVAEWRRVGGAALEIGTFQGVAAGVFADAMPDNRLVCLDTFEANHDAIATWLANQRPNATLIVGDADTLERLMPPRQFRLILVDGGHDYDACLCDVDVALRHALDRPGSILVHDYTCQCFAGIRRACLELLGVPTTIVNTLAIYRLPAIAPDEKETT